MVTWKQILDSILQFFQNIGDFANWLFTPLQVGEWDTENQFLLWVHGIIEQLLEQIDFAPIHILGIGTFTLLLIIGILKMVL